MSDSVLIDWEQLEMIFGEEDEEFDEDMAELFHEFVEDVSRTSRLVRSILTKTLCAATRTS